jgi:hypothetical protein
METEIFPFVIKIDRRRKFNNEQDVFALLTDEHVM